MTVGQSFCGINGNVVHSKWSKIKSEKDNLKIFWDCWKHVRAFVDIRPQDFSKFSFTSYHEYFNRCCLFVSHRQFLFMWRFHLFLLAAKMMWKNYKVKILWLLAVEIFHSALFRNVYLRSGKRVKLLKLHDHKMCINKFVSLQHERAKLSFLIYFCIEFFFTADIEKTLNFAIKNLPETIKLNEQWLMNKWGSAASYYEWHQMFQTSANGENFSEGKHIKTKANDVCSFLEKKTCGNLFSCHMQT